MSAYFLSRARLSDAASVKAIRSLLFSDAASHSLVWSLFADDETRNRDFLFRESDDGWFYILSARKPNNGHGLFVIDEPKEFEPMVATGDRLRFSLRANPVKRRRIAGTRKSRKVDVVMDALHELTDPSERAARREEYMIEAGTNWLADQGCKHGFLLGHQMEEPGPRPRVAGYRQYRFRRKGARSRLSFSSVDFDGVLEVTDPDRFRKALHAGLGSAKAYGCGLMLIRRV